MIKIILFSILLASVYGCESKKKEFSYIFMGHTYDTEPIIDKRIKIENLKTYDQIWLGGDITSNSGEKWKLDYLDSVFKIKSNQTHWAFGNHDIRNGRDILVEYINKPPYYATNVNGITLLVYDTNYNDNGDCDDVNKQSEYIKMVCDTIQNSSHLILMGHHVPWGKIDSNIVMNYANTSLENRVFQCDTFDFFHNVIYPKLVDVQQKNIQVICLAGDLGQKQSTYQYKTNEGIYFLGSGLLSTNNYNTKFSQYGKSDSVLVFSHIPSKRTLNWKFKKME